MTLLRRDVPIHELAADAKAIEKIHEEALDFRGGVNWMFAPKDLNGVDAVLVKAALMRVST